MWITYAEIFKRSNAIAPFVLVSNVILPAREVYWDRQTNNSMQCICGSRLWQSSNNKCHIRWGRPSCRRPLSDYRPASCRRQPTTPHLRTPLPRGRHQAAAESAPSSAIACAPAWTTSTVTTWTTSVCMKQQPLVTSKQKHYKLSVFISIEDTQLKRGI